MVDIETELSRMVIGDFHVLRGADIERAKYYVKTPDDYDFDKILEWEYDPEEMVRPA